MGDDTVPLREHLEMRLDYVEKLREQDRDFYLAEAQNLSNWREQTAMEIASIRARIATIIAGFSALLALIQIWRGMPWGGLPIRQATLPAGHQQHHMAIELLAVLLVIAFLLWLMSLFITPMGKLSQAFLIAWMALATIMLAGVNIEIGGGA